MRLVLPILLVPAFALALLGVAIASEPSEFEWSAAIVLHGQTGAVTFELPFQALAEIDSPAKMRIFDGARQEVPFSIHTSGGKNTSGRSLLRLYNSVISPSKSQSVEFELPQGEQELTQLNLLIANRNYNCATALFGREQATKDFRLIKSGMRLIRLYSVDEKINYEHNSLRFPPQKFPLYKLVIECAPEELPLQIESVYFIHKELIPAKTHTHKLGLQYATLSEEEQNLFWPVEQNTSFYELTPPYPRLPLCALNFDFSGDNFARTARIYAVPTSRFYPSALVASTTVFRFGSESNKQLSFSPHRGERYLMVIRNGNDRPVEVVRAVGTSVVTDVRFFVDTNSSFVPPFRFYYGRSNALEPQYDIQARLSRLREDSFQKVELDQIQPNPRFQPKEHLPVTEESRIWLYIAVALLVAVLMIYLIRLLARQGHF